MERINPNPRFYNTSPQQKVAKKVDNSHGKITNKPSELDVKQRVVISPIPFIVVLG